MVLADLQRRTRELGRIRIGHQVQGGNGKMRPEKLEAFRFTSPSRKKIEAVADIFGGEPLPWDRSAEHRPDEWQVFTTTTELHVIVPPDQTLSQWWEMWSGGGVQRRCDGITRQGKQAGEPCLCPADTGMRGELAGQNPPGACKPHSRLNVMIPDIPDLGTWGIQSTGMNAAVEWPGAVDVLEKHRPAGVFLPAQIRLEQRTRKTGGQTRHFAVVVVEIENTLRELVGGNTDQLPPAPARVLERQAQAQLGGGRPAIEAAVSVLSDNADQLASMALASDDYEYVVAIGKHAKQLGLLDAVVEPNGTRPGPLSDLLYGRIEAIRGNRR
jgi:hypothetical protein